MVSLRLAALWLGLIAPVSGPDGRGTGGEVISDALEVLDEPVDSGYGSAELKRGARVSIVDAGPAGWLTIAPPPDTFNWIDASGLRVEADDRAVVVASRATVRTGADQARMPGPPRAALLKGTVVRLLDHPALTLGEGPKARTWRAIAPQTGEVRYVRADGVKLDPVPMTSQSFDPRVQAAQAPQVDPGAGSASDAIRKFEDALDRSRRIDHDVAQVKRKLADARISTEPGYDAKGLLQASSRRVDGQKVHALIGPEGRAIAYLAIPPGIPASRLLARKVGVRGETRFNESLGARLITVRDLDPLDKPR